MNRRIVDILAVSLALTFVGCGKGFCERQKKAVESCGEDYSDEDAAYCEEVIEGCTASEERALVRFVECSERYDAVCSSYSSGSTYDGEDLAALSCYAELEDLSTECLEGTG